MKSPGFIQAEKQKMCLAFANVQQKKSIPYSGTCCQELVASNKLQLCNLGRTLLKVTVGRRHYEFSIPMYNAEPIRLELPSYRSKSMSAKHHKYSLFQIQTTILQVVRSLRCSHYRACLLIGCLTVVWGTNYTVDWQRRNTHHDPSPRQTP